MNLHLTKQTNVFTQDANIPLVTAALLLGIFAIGLETLFHVPVRLPGHRAFPGALAILVAAQAFAPLLLVIFASVVSSYLVINGQYQPWIIGVWLFTAILAYGIGKTRFAQKFAYFIICGTVFGLLMYAAKFSGFHKTPEILRAGGHLAFGALGGTASFGLHRALKSKGAQL